MPHFQPDSHFFIGNLLAATGNMSGAVHHYQEALAQNPLHHDAYSSLRIINCYQKFHRTAQSSVPKETPPTPCDNGQDGKTAATGGGCGGDTGSCIEYIYIGD